MNFGPLIPYEQRPDAPWWLDRPDWAEDEHAWRRACAEVAGLLGEDGPMLDQSGVRRALQRIPGSGSQSASAFLGLNDAAAQVLATSSTLGPVPEPSFSHEGDPDGR